MNLMTLKMEKSSEEHNALWFARTLEANKQKHKKRLQEKMQTPEFLRSIESLKHNNATTI
jgi:hypothetical protein